VPIDENVEIYDAFGTDFQKLSASEKQQVGSLLEALRTNPYEPELQKKCLLHREEVFEYPLDGGHSVFWKVYYPSLSVTELSGKVHILAIERRSGK